jgi:hypothetical protein
MRTTRCHLAPAQRHAHLRTRVRRRRLARLHAAHTLDREKGLTDRMGESARDRALEGRARWRLWMRSDRVLLDGRQA